MMAPQSIQEDPQQCLPSPLLLRCVRILGVEEAWEGAVFANGGPGKEMGSVYRPGVKNLTWAEGLSSSAFISHV